MGLFALVQFEYSSPFTDEFAAGPNSVFADEPELQDLIAVLAAIRDNAVGPQGVENGAL